RHLANGFTTPRIGANQFLRRTVNAQTNPWQNISIASAISSSRTRRISGPTRWATSCWRSRREAGWPSPL
ncbi:hypothetical protein CLD20_19780, partial [Afifella sp. IM 167]|nr:hypothetical protein [Afifella sp. IM 167]